MKLSQCLTIVGLFCVEYAQSSSPRICRHPAPKVNFNWRKFSGSFFLAAKDVTDALDAKYENDRCSIAYFHKDIGNHRRNKWKVDFQFGENGVSDLGGTYYLPNPQLGFLKMFYAAGNFTYDVTVMGSSYDSWAVVYACAEITPTYTSEWVILYLRNLSDYEDVVEYSRVRRLVRRVSDKTVTELRKIPTTNCPANYNGLNRNYS